MKSGAAHGMLSDDHKLYIHMHSPGLDSVANNCWATMGKLPGGADSCMFDWLCRTCSTLTRHTNWCPKSKKTKERNQPSIVSAISRQGSQDHAGPDGIHVGDEEEADVPRPTLPPLNLDDDPESENNFVLAEDDDIVDGDMFGLDEVDSELVAGILAAQVCAPAPVEPTCDLAQDASTGRLSAEMMPHAESIFVRERTKLPKCDDGCIRATKASNQEVSVSFGALSSSLPPDCPERYVLSAYELCIFDVGAKHADMMPDPEKIVLPCCDELNTGCQLKRARFTESFRVVHHVGKSYLMKQVMYIHHNCPKAKRPGGSSMFSALNPKMIAQVHIHSHIHLPILVYVYIYISTYQIHSHIPNSFTYTYTHTHIFIHICS